MEREACKALLGPTVLWGNKGNKEVLVHRDLWGPRGAPVPRENLGSLEFRGRKVTQENLERMVTPESKGRRGGRETAEKKGAGVYLEKREITEFRGRVEWMVKLAPQDTLGNQGK